MLQIVRWIPNRKIIFVGDSSFGTHALANRISRRATLISRFRLDANLFEPPPETKKRGITCESAQVEGRAWQMPSGEWVCVDLPAK